MVAFPLFKFLLHWKSKLFPIFPGVAGYQILAVDEAAKLVQGSDKKRSVFWANSEIAIRSCGQVPDGKPKAEDQRRGSSAA